MFQTGKNKWRSLENTAKIFPATSSAKDERVFRFACELTEPVHPEKLQRALEQTLVYFPSFLCVMRKGFFWNYMEDMPVRARVKEEDRPPCSQMYVHDQKNLLFEVTYYKNRINFETYHALTDGTGALQFLRTLVYAYLRERYPGKISGNVREKLQMDATEDEKVEDSFLKYYRKERPGEEIPKYKAHQLSYRKLEHGDFRLTEGRADTGEILQAAKKHGTTVTAFLTAVYLMAAAEDMSPRQKKRPVALMVPVNLRNFFPSRTMRNFFGWIDIGYTFDGSETLDEVIAFVAEFFKREITPEKMEERMGRLMDFERNPLVRILPLELKTPAMQIGAAASTGEVTAVFSNIGQIKMPEECVSYIRRFTFFTTTPKIELCLCSWQEEMTFGFTSAYANERLEKNFFALLEREGIQVTLLDEKERYPDTRREKTLIHRGFQWFTFLCVAVIALAQVINWVVYPQGWWGKYVLAGAGCAWILAFIGLAKRRDLLKNAVWQMIVVSLLLTFWDFLTGWKGWSVNWGIPLAVTAVLLLMAGITAVLKLPPERYMIYFLMVCTVGLVLFGLAFFGVLTVRFPSALCGILSFLVLAAFLIFRRQTVVEELKKKFHF